jgi:AAA domain
MIHGLAGTGKTTVMAEVARELGDRAILGAPMGKAASVLTTKTGIAAKTLHELLYRPIEVVDPKTNDPKRISEPGTLRGKLEDRPPDRSTCIR